MKTIQRKTNTNKKYQITPLIWFVKDEATTKFHVENDDYFGTIATILSLVKQKINDQRPQNQKLLQDTLNNLEKDLGWLQNNYQIVEKKK
jgi:hypothetical protein